MSLASTQDPIRTTTLTIPPLGRVAHALDVGPYTLHATASAETQFGPRTAGQLTRQFIIDPRATGWQIEFRSSDLR